MSLPQRLSLTPWLQPGVWAERGFETVSTVSLDKPLKRFNGAEPEPHRAKATVLMRLGAQKAVRPSAHEVMKPGDQKGMMPRSAMSMSSIMNTDTSGSVPARAHLSIPALSRQSSGARCQGFTMIEIAISLAIIGFALVAIIGILPAGLNAQRDNRQETIVNQDASILMDAVRNGERGLDDLTNYIVGITNYVTDYTPAGVPGTQTRFGYTLLTSTKNEAPTNPRLPLTNGYNIVGLLSTPKILLHSNGRGYISNHVVAVFRSLSGPASEKPPQVNPTMQELALSYRLVADVSAYSTNFFDPGWTNYSVKALNTNEVALRSNYMVLVTNLQLNLHDLRLTFLWPLLPSGKVGSGRQVYRTMVAGHYTNDPPGSPYFFLQPRTFY